MAPSNPPAHLTNIHPASHAFALFIPQVLHTDLFDIIRGVVLFLFQKWGTYCVQSQHRRLQQTLRERSAGGLCEAARPVKLHCLLVDLLTDVFDLPHHVSKD